jgi:hypothetical protein
VISTNRIHERNELFSDSRAGKKDVHTMNYCTKQEADGQDISTSFWPAEL